MLFNQLIKFNYIKEKHSADIIIFGAIISSYTLSRKMDRSKKQLLDNEAIADEKEEFD